MTPTTLRDVYWLDSDGFVEWPHNGLIMVVARCRGEPSPNAPSGRTVFTIKRNLN